MADKLKVAVIGTSIGCKLHVRALRGAGFEVTTLVGQDPEKTRDKAAYFGVPVATTSYDAVMDSDVDVVIVATPPAAHHPQTMQAIAAGKHVLCEKPFCLDIGQGREMRDAAREQGIVDQVDQAHRWYAHRAALREVVRSGQLGDVFHSSLMFDHSMIATGLHDLPGWWLDNAQGGGWIRNFASHGIDFARYVLGEIVAVSGRLHNDPSRGMTADDSYSFVFEVAGGGQGIMSGSCRAWDTLDQVRVTGTKGGAGYTGASGWVKDAEGTRDLKPSDELARSLLVEGGEPAAPTLSLPKGDNVYANIHNSDHGYREQVCLLRAFRRRIEDATFTHPAVATFDDGIAHMKVILGVEESARKGSWVDLEPR